METFARAGGFFAEWGPPESPVGKQPATQFVCDRTDGMPMHSIWLAASLARHMQMLFTDATPADPNELLQALKHEVMTQGT